MKKSLIALAVLAASGAAMAQSSVTLYGIADAGVFKEKGVSADLRSGGLNSSRLGFKGTEDLGGGLAANFLLEQGIDLTSGKNGEGFTRQAYVGLSGGFGEIKLGNVYTAYDDIAAGAALAFDSGKFDSQDIFGSMAYNANPETNIYYATPSFGGFSGAVSYELDATKERVASFHVKYEGGPLFVALGYQDASDATTGTGAGSKVTVLNGTYNFGSFKLLAAYGTDDATDADDISIGAEIPFGAFTLSAGYAMSDRGAAGDAKGVAIMGTYDLSKRTALYLGYRNDNDVAVGVGGTDQIIGFGIRHRF